MEYFVKDHGAIGDGSTLNTVALQSVIDTCHQNGGGRVTVSDGVYMTGTLILKSNVELHITANATLLGSPRCEDYPEFNKNHVIMENLPRWQSACMIFAEECENIAISGSGRIDANGESFIELDPNEGAETVYRRISTKTPPRVVFFTGCKNVSITDVTMQNQPAGWSYWIHDCDLVNFDRIKILANVQYPNNDGIHINCSQNVTVSNSTVNCGDDSLVIRANSRSLHENKPCERVTVTNCSFTSHSGGVRVGWINDGVIRNCTFSNIIMTDTTVGISVFLPPAYWAPSDYGREETLIENLSFSNIIMDDNYSMPIYIDIMGTAEDTKVKAIRNLYFDNIRARGLKLPYLRGRADAPIENVQFTNCTFEELDRATCDDGKNHSFIMPDAWKDAHTLTLSHVKGIVMNNTTFTVNE